MKIIIKKENGKSFATNSIKEIKGFLSWLSTKTFVEDSQPKVIFEFSGYAEIKTFGNIISEILEGTENGKSLAKKFEDKE